MGTSDSTPGSLAALPIQPRNPTTLSSPWSPWVLISSFPPLVFQTKMGSSWLIPTTTKFFSRSPNILVCEAKSHSVSGNLMGDLCCQTPEKLQHSSGQCRVPFHHTTFSQGCREREKKIKNQQEENHRRVFCLWAACHCAARGEQSLKGRIYMPALPDKAQMLLPR